MIFMSRTNKTTLECVLTLTVHHTLIKYFGILRDYMLTIYILWTLAVSVEVAQSPVCSGSE